MYHIPSISCLYEHPLPSQAPTAPATPDIVSSTPPPEPDTMLDSDERVALKTPISVITRVSPQPLTITPLKPTSPTSSDADSEGFDDTSNSPCSFIGGEECPDLCGGFKNACRSWTPPASPFYYTNEGGIFLLDDRPNYEERQKIELGHTLLDLDARLQRLRETMSPPRCLSRLHEYESSTPKSPSGEPHNDSASLPRSPTQTLVEHSLITTTSPRPSPRKSSSPPRRRKIWKIRRARVPIDSLNNIMNIKKIDKNGTTDLGKLIHTSLQHVQSTNSPPRYLAKVSETEAQPLLTEPITFPNSYGQLREGASLTRHTSPQLHFGNTAYPTPLPSSPESKPIRKRKRDDGSHENIDGRKRGGENGIWSPT